MESRFTQLASSARAESIGLNKEERSETLKRVDSPLHIVEKSNFLIIVRLFQYSMQHFAGIKAKT